MDYHTSSLSDISRAMVGRGKLDNHTGIDALSLPEKEQLHMFRGLQIGNGYLQEKQLGNL